MLDAGAAKTWAQVHGISAELRDLVAHEALLAEIERAVEEVNRHVSRVEQIKRFAVLPRDFSQEEGEVTPTLKLRRRVIHEHFADEIENLYAGEPG